jgi:hypothetical protein
VCLLEGSFDSREHLTGSRRRETERLNFYDHAKFSMSSCKIPLFGMQNGENRFLSSAFWKGKYCCQYWPAGGPVPSVKQGHQPGQWILQMQVLQEWSMVHAIEGLVDLHKG